MARMGGSTRVKRSMAPAFWRIPRKKARFSIRVQGGPHRKDRSYALMVLLRDILHLVKTAREGDAVLQGERVLVDGKPRHEPGFPIGLMDVVEIPSIGRIYRLLPHPRYTLYPVTVSEAEKSLKLCLVGRKVTVAGGKVRLGMHDGRSLLMGGDTKIREGDACLIDIASDKVLASYGLQKGSQALVTGGEKAGLTGVVQEIKPGTMTRSAMVVLAMATTSTELPIHLVMPIGEGKIPVTVSAESQTA